MALDLTRLVSQVGEMISRLKSDGDERQRRFDNAWQTLAEHAGKAEDLKRRIDASKIGWLYAGIVEGLGGHYPPSPLPDDFVVVASDGSQIDVDRHRSPRCYLINIGSAVLRYGSTPAAALESQSHLSTREEDLVIRDRGNPAQEQVIQGAILGLVRDVREVERLVDLAGNIPAECPALALVDGTLIKWGLRQFANFVTDELLEGAFLRLLDELRKRSEKDRLALASYISYPGGSDVVNTLKVALCPREKVDTDTDCPSCQTRECDAIARIRDRDLFGEFLACGERTDVFRGSSMILDRYGPHRVYFFYLNVDDEIARLEVPEWVATDPDRLGLAHALVLDQCRRGHGYPVALSEAHEKAVITSGDVENFWRLVELQMADEGLFPTGSAKSRSKRTRRL